MAGASTEVVHGAGATLIESWTKPTLLIWSSEDPVFPLEHARRYAEALPNAELVEIDDSYSFTPEDQPQAVADAIAAFARLSQASTEAGLSISRLRILPVGPLGSSSMNQTTRGYL